MAENLLPPYAKLLYSGATVAASANSATLTLPLADSYSFIADVGTITGTSPTFDIAIQMSPDGGTTWYDWWRFAQFAAAGVRRLTTQPMQGRGEAGSEAAISTAGTGALSANANTTQTVRVEVTAGGTSPSAATIKVWVVATPRSAGS